MSTTSVKCACDRCSCEMSLENAIKKDGNYYCCEACANGHADGKGCASSGCGCS